MNMRGIHKTEAKEPKRARGKQRVADLLDAGAALIAEKGYEATTMTEIAQRAGASIGSLYQFFPSKEALALGLFERYAQRAAELVDHFVENAPGLSAIRLADLLVDMMLELRAHRLATMALSDSIAGIAERRHPLRNKLRVAVALTLRAANGRLSEEQAAVAAYMIAQVLKTVQTLAAEEAESGLPHVAEARRMLAVYIGHMVKLGMEEDRERRAAR
jgi:AcrR family transcriptional regulator